MVNKQKQKNQKNFRNYGRINKELNALIEKKIQKFDKNNKRRETEKELQHFQEMQISDDESKRASPAWHKAWKVEKFHPCLNNNYND